MAFNLDVWSVMWWAVIVFETVLVFRLFVKIKSPVAPLLVMIYIVFVQVLYSFAARNLLGDHLSDLSLKSFSERFSETMSVYTSIYIIALFSLHKLFKKSTQDRSTLINSLNGVAKTIAKTKFFLVAYLSVVVYLSFLKWDVAWRNSEYLLMNSPGALNVPASFAIALRMLLSGVGLYTTLLIPYFLATKNFTKAAFLAPLYIFVLGYQLSSHSRSAAVSLFITFSIFVMLKERNKLGWSLIGVVCVISALVFALVGRVLDYHGFSTIAETISVIYKTIDSDSIVFALVNMGQGVFATGDSLLLNANHNYAYRLLSFSPFPSWIDGFDELLKCCEIRVNEFVPMSAIAEAVSFGYMYSLVFFVTLYYSLRVNARLMLKRLDIVSLVLNISLFVIFVSANAYPMRNVFRQLLLVTVCALIYAGYVKEKNRFNRK